MNNISYTLGGHELLGEIKELWEGLNEHHRKESLHFSAFYSTFSFDTRKAYFMEKAQNGQLRVEIAYDEASQRQVGYCISSMDNGKKGEIESIYILQNYRGDGIGEELMKKALQWMDDTGANKKTVSVAVGNEAAFKFYAKFGFYPRLTVLEQIEDRG